MVRVGWKYVFIGACIGMIGHQTRNLVHACRHHVHQYTVTVDTPLSPHAQREISQYIQKKQYTTAVDAMHGIQKQFGYIRSVQAHAYANGTVALTIIGADPYLIINTEYLLTANGSLAHTNRYVPASYTEAPHLYAPGHNLGSALELIQKATTNIDLNLLRQYDVMLMSEQDIRLTPPEKPWITLKCSLEKFPDADLLLQSYALCEQHMSPKKDGSVVADLRFKNQIIITKG